MKFINEEAEAWFKKQQEECKDDIYARAIIDYAIRWAELMEQRLESGEKLEDNILILRPDKRDIEDPLWLATSHEADTDGMTGFMYGITLKLLSKCWIHGEELRILHNAYFGVDENEAKGGVVNPAIMIVKGKE